MNNNFLYLGTYTGPTSNGEHRRESIYLYRIDPASGQLDFQAAFNGGPNPSYLVVSADHRFLYTVNEIESEGFISTFAIQPATGALTFINRQPSGGGLPCYLSFDPTGRWLLVANYGTGSLAVLPIQSDGSLAPVSCLVEHRGSGPNALRQEAAHAHAVRFDPSGSFALATDLGADRVYIYRWDAAQGRLQAHEPAALQLTPGAGPRHMAFHPQGRFLYVSDELDSTVTVCKWNAAEGLLQSIQVISTLPQGWSGSNDVAHIQIAPSGKHLYVSNRGHDSLAIFEVMSEGGQLRPIGHLPTQGHWPRNFSLDPEGRWLLIANQKTDTLIPCRVDLTTGQLTPTGQKVSIPSPVFVLLVG